jgi:threonine dehydratase
MRIRNDAGSATVITEADVEAALSRVRPDVHETPLVSATRLGKRSGDVHLMLKCESMQRTGSFKAGGAVNAMMQLTDAERARGVVTVSTGKPRPSAVVGGGRRRLGRRRGDA